MSFFDVHTHIVPGIDDGAENEEEALSMLKTSYLSGVRDIILTPHYNEEMGYTQNAVSCCLKLNELAKSIAADMSLYIGNEIFYSSDTTQLLRNKKIATLADSKYVLIEFSYDISLKDMLFASNEIQLQGYWPVIAHAERYECMYRKKSPELLFHSGAYIQINAGSIISSKLKTKQLIKKLLKNDLVSFIGSDCHGCKYRPPNIGQCALILEEKYGTEFANKLLYENPRCIIENKKIYH